MVGLGHMSTAAGPMRELGPAVSCEESGGRQLCCYN